MARPFQNVLLLLGILQCLMSCRYNTASLQINIKTQTIDGQPVPGAIIVLDDEEIGQTNAFGTFSAKTSISAEKRHKITITKSDQTYYYAPHFESFKSKAGQDVELSIQPIMYSVPKPKEKLKKNRETTTKSVEILANHDPFASELHGEEEAFWPQLLTLSKQDLSAKEQAPLSESAQLNMFTSHVYAGKIPLENARVTWFTGKGESTSCVTNSRGRCVIRTSHPLSQPGQLLIKRSGYKSALSTLTPREHGNIWSALDPGHSIDIQGFEANPWTRQPLAGITISGEGVGDYSTNDWGLAVIPTVHSFPIKLKVTNPKDALSYELVIRDAGESLHLVNFSDNSTSGWKTMYRFPTYIESSSTESIPILNQTMIESLLAEKFTGEKLTITPQDFKRIEPGSMAYLPVLRLKNARLELAVVAFTTQGVEAKSRYVNISSPTQSESWSKATTEIAAELMESIPWPGTISNIKKNEALISMNSRFVKPNDIITIAAENGVYETPVLRVGNTGPVISLNSLSKSIQENPWAFLGSLVRKKIPHSRNYSLDLDFKIENLKALDIDPPSITLAKKFLGEGNHDEALKALDLTAKSSEDQIKSFEMRAVIEASRRNRPGVINALRQIMKISAKEGLERSLMITEINLISNQIESTPAIPGDITLADHFKELTTKLGSLLKEASRHRNDPQMMTTVKYYQLLSHQKESECRADLVALAMMSGEWEEFEKTVLDSSSSLTNPQAWISVIRGNRNKVAITSSDDKKAM